MIPQQRTLLAFVKTLIGVFLCLGLIAFFVMHSILNQQPPGKRKLAWHTSLPVEEVWLGEGEKTSIDGVKEKLSALKDEVKELETIKFAAINDLRDLEGKRYAYQEVIKGLSAEKLKIFNEVQKAQRGLSKLKKELGILQSAVAAKRLQVNIPIGMPKKLNGVTNEIQNNKLDSKSSKRHCTFSNCFDYSHCSLLNQFSAYVYKPSMMHNLPFIDIKKTRVVHNKLIKLPHVSTSPEKACLFVYVIVLKSSILHYQKGILSRHMEKLHHWKNNGQNHLILFLSNYSSDVCKYVSEITKTKAIVATSIVCRNTFRDQFDQILYPPDFLSLDSNSQDISMSLVPIKRKYLFAFIENTYVPEISNTDLIALKGRAQDIFIKVGCGRTEHKLADEFMANCNNKAPVVEILRESVFNILFDVKSSEDLEKLHRDILLSLVNGVIPVIIGENTLLPFSEFVDYKKFIIMIPPARITEAHYILRTIKKTEVFAMKQQGRFVYETYFSSLDANLRTIFSGVQSYIKLPPLPLLAYKSTPLFNNSTSLKTGRPDSEAIKSWSYSYNWTTTSIGLYEQWNSYPGAHYLLQFIPKNVGMPPSVQFFEDVNEYMPIGAGEGGDGSKFKNALGGDYAIEHFTIVILTYDRELILVESLQRLSGLKYLNKVIVIWNNPIMPSSELEWPDIGVPLHVIKGDKNSLNNRFIPYDLIDTEAILSMDDDIYLRYDEIELAFRVWRENRDRIVGFPGRFYSWSADGGLNYNANYSCELSMVLTGGAFFHKYYSYLYTYLMPHAIRDMVDEYMNCEDIALNFLVAHVTGRPPIKVTSRWTFRCPGCPTSLSNDHSHYTERAKCLQFFKRIYGYMPLRRTQFRADSVLFKTRLPPTKQKCYQFV